MAGKQPLMWLAELGEKGSEEKQSWNKKVTYENERTRTPYQSPPLTAVRRHCVPENEKKNKEKGYRNEQIG